MQEATMNQSTIQGDRTENKLFPGTLTIIREKEQWEAAIKKMRAADVYYSYEYCKAAAQLENGKAMLICYTGLNGAILYPVILRKVSVRGRKTNFFDLTTPYGYGGPLLEGDSSLVAEFRSAFHELCRNHSIISEFIRFHPLVGNAAYSETYAKPLPIQQTTAVDLQGEMEEIRSRYSSMNKRNLKKAQKSGLTCREAEKTEDNIQIFSNLYLKTMKRKNASNFYFFEIPSIKRQLADSVASSAHLLFVYKEERVVATGILFISRDTAHYHLGASDADSLEFRPNNLLFDSMVQLAKEKGCKLLHLGGGYKGGDSLFKFKTSFTGSNNFDFHIGKNIIDQDAYNSLVQTIPGEVLLETSFFPAYRITV